MLETQSWYAVFAPFLLSFVNNVMALSLSKDDRQAWNSKGIEWSDPPPPSYPMEDAVPSFLALDDGTDENDERQLAYHYSPGKSSPGVLFCNGFQSSMQGTKAVAMETYCRQRGVPFCRFDYRGHGDHSTEEFSHCTLSDWIQDASTILETVMKDHDKVVVMGSSMGGWIACHLALQHPHKVVGLLGIAAAPDFLEDIFQNLSQEQQDQWKREGFLSLPTEYNPEPYHISWKLVEDARQKWNLLSGPNRKIIPIRCRVHLVHGKVDQDIPWTKSLDLMDRLETKDVTLTIIKDGDHRLSRPQDIERIQRALGELLQNAF